jgi:phosphatidylinositol glycan class Q protein
MRKGRSHWSESCTRNRTSVLESFPTVCGHASYQGSGATTWYVLLTYIQASLISPGGVYLELLDTSAATKKNDPSTSMPTAYVLLKVRLLFQRIEVELTPLQSVPLSLRAMFHPYFELGGRIRKHYLSPSVFLSLASGQFVPPIHRRTLYSLQYSMLPANRATVEELWQRLNEKELLGNGALNVFQPLALDRNAPTTNKVADK